EPERSLPEPGPTHPEAPGSASALVGEGGGGEGSKATPGLTRLESWIAPDLDAWVIEREELTPLAYAELWIRDGGTTPRDGAFDRMLGAWLDDFAERRVTAIGFGYVLLRKPIASDAARLRRFEKVS